MKRLLLSFAMLLALVGTVAAVTKKPLLLTGTSPEGVLVEPYGSSTMEELYAATFTPTQDLKNIFQYRDFDTEDFNKLVVKFAEPVSDGWNIHAYGGQGDFFSLDGRTEYIIKLTGEIVPDFTIFNWFGCRTPITITECYLLNDGTGFAGDDDDDEPETPVAKGKGTWVSLIQNGTADEGDDLESFPVSLDGPNNGDTANDRPEIVDGGVDGTKCLKVVSDQLEEKFKENGDKDWTTWSAQFYILLNEELPVGESWRLKMSIRADRPATISTSSQAEPRAWKGGFVDAFDVTDEWQDFEWSDKNTVEGFKSIAFDLNNDANSNTFYFDNIVFEKYVPSINAEFGGQTIQVAFPFPTNIADLVKACGKARLQYPVDCAAVKVNGETVGIDYVEGDASGVIYVFPNESIQMSEGDQVEVTFKNPADAAFHVAYADEAKGAIETVEMEADWNGDLDEIMPDSFNDPVLVSAVPENRSFNLPNNISEFTLTFDKDVDCAKLTAKINKETLAKTPATGFSKEVKLTRSGADLADGVYVLNVTNIFGEFSSEDFPESEDIEFCVGPVSSDDEPALIYQSNFTGNGENSNGAGWITNRDGGGMQPASSGSGCNIRHNQNSAFVPDVMYLCQRGTALGVALYGTEEDYKLALEAKTYHLSLDACKWDRDGIARTLRVQVFPEDAVNAEDGTVAEGVAPVAQDVKDITPTMASKETVHFDLAVTIPAEGNYVIRMTTHTDDGDKYGDGCAIANIKFEYIPGVPGVMEVRALRAALEDAKNVKESAEDDKYEGASRDALDAKIQQYDGQETVMTAPSAFAKAVEELNAVAKTMRDHIAFCDGYYNLAMKAYDLSVSKQEKFGETDYYKEVKAAADKYVTVEGEGEEAEVIVVKETDTDKLSAAKDELSAVTNMAEKWLTEGKSNNEQTSGFAALHERIRRGTELLKTLGVAEDDELIVAADATLGDDDSVAGAIMNRVSSIILSDLASGESQLFAANEEDETAPSYDLSVFVKNPNTYGPASSKEVPGWTATKGSVWAWSSWDGAKTHDNVLPPYPEDCSIHAGWHPNGEQGAIVEQTIENLPAGIYSVKLQFWENGEKPGADTESLIDYSFAFAKVSDTPSPEVDEETGAPVEDFDPELHTVGYTTDQSNLITDIEVLDGKLTVGYHYGKKSQAFLQDVSIFLTAPADGFNYADAYQKFVTGVDAAKTLKVRALEVYDLNGHRLVNAKKGINIIKKVMSDGTVQTTKVVK